MPCRVCESDRLLSVLDLGATPPCEKVLTVDDVDQSEATYPLHLRAGGNCLLCQIAALITPEETFTEYAYFSSYSDSWVEHAGRFVGGAVQRPELDQNSFVVEVASNDGYLLKHVIDAGVRCLGIEPSVNVGAAAVARGVPTVTAFLDEATATAVLVALAQFDAIYHEHLQYYTVASAANALAAAGLTVVDVETVPTRGGSIRLWVRPADTAGPPHARAAEVLATEAAAGLHDVTGYVGLRQRVERQRPYKHGKFTPGARLPIHPVERLDLRSGSRP